MPTLYIQLFGAFQVTVDDQPWDGFRSDKVRALLAYLALEGTTPRRRSQLMALLWSGFKPTFARANLRMTLANLRQLVAPFDVLQTTRQAVRWYTPHANWHCDALLLDQVLQADNQPSAEWRHTVDHLYQGEFLPGFEQIDSLPWQLWLQDKRAYYAEQVAAARKRSEPPRPLFTTPDWGAIPRVAQFHGRHAERNALQQWLVDEHCHLVGIFGIGGQGKTALAAIAASDFVDTVVDKTVTATTLANPGAPAVQSRQVAPFTRVIWRSLTTAPALSEILLSWLQILAKQQIAQLPALLEDQLALLIGYLQREPILLVLDNLESILQSGGHAGRYQPGYELYGELLRRLAASEHRSCLLLVSREQPQEFQRLQTQEVTVRALHLRGLEQNDAQQLVLGRGLSAPASATTALVQRYAGHPLALQVALETVQECFGGKIADFLAHSSLIMADLHTVLDQHFVRLSPLEQTILIWLTIEATPITRQALLAKLTTPPPLGIYLEAERSLLRRFQLETYGERLGLQKLMRAYLTEYLINQIYLEVRPTSDESVHTAWTSRTWIAESHVNCYGLGHDECSTAADAQQGPLILQTVAKRLMAHFGQAHVLAYLRRYLARLQQEPAPLPGYAALNLLYLVRQLGAELHDTALALPAAVTTPGGRLHLVDNA